MTSYYESYIKTTQYYLDLQEEKDNLYNINNKLVEDINKLKQEFQNLKKSQEINLFNLENSKNLIDVNNKNIEEKNKTIYNLQKIIIDLETKLAYEINKTMDDIKQINLLNKDICDLADNNKELKKEFNNINIKNKDLKNENKDLKGEIKDLKDENKDLKDEVNKLNFKLNLIEHYEKERIENSKEISTQTNNINYDFEINKFSDDENENTDNYNDYNDFFKKIDINLDNNDFDEHINKLDLYTFKSISHYI